MLPVGPGFASALGALHMIFESMLCTRITNWHSTILRSSLVLAERWGSGSIVYALVRISECLRSPHYLPDARGLAS